MWARISKRNEFHANDPNSIYFSESDLQRYRTRFVPPRQTSRTCSTKATPQSWSQPWRPFSPDRY
ncbi:hypothetical protein GCM10020295_43460 [Streptomyces cinereospinus]